MSAGESYPTELLRDGESALVLFAAYYLGRQDAFWIAEANMRATCVDIREHKVREMRELYPENWKFVTADVYEYASQLEDSFDVVSLDPPTGQFEMVADLIDLWCELSNRVVIMGSNRRTDAALKVPPGWTKSRSRHRSSFDGGTCWTVMELA